MADDSTNSPSPLPYSRSVRRNETVFMREVERWYEKLLPTLVPFLYQNYGPIIAVQVLVI